MNIVLASWRRAAFEGIVFYLEQNGFFDLYKVQYEVRKTTIFSVRASLGRVSLRGVT